MKIRFIALLSSAALVAVMILAEIAFVRMTQPEEPAKAMAIPEEIYHRTDYDSSDGLAQPNSAEISLIDKAFADAENESQRHVGGYVFSIVTSCSGTNYADYIDAQIKSQQSTAPAAKMPASPPMTLGYALIPQPAAYDSTGRDSFMISNAGTIYMSDQGLTFDEIEAKRKLMKQGLTEQQAQEQVRKMQPNFNPVAPTWTPTE